MNIWKVVERFIAHNCQAHTGSIWPMLLVQGSAERFSDFAARRSGELLSCGAPSVFSRLAAGTFTYIYKIWCSAVI